MKLKCVPHQNYRSLLRQPPDTLFRYTNNVLPSQSKDNKQQLLANKTVRNTPCAIVATTCPVYNTSTDNGYIQYSVNTAKPVPMAVNTSVKQQI